MSTTRIFVLPSILFKKRFRKFSKSVKHVIFKINCPLCLYAMKILSICLFVCHFAYNLHV